MPWHVVWISQRKRKKPLALKPSPCDRCHSSLLVITISDRLAASFMEVISCRLFSFSTSAWAKCLFTMPFKKTQLQITVKTNKICSKYEVRAKLQATSSNYNEGTFPKLTCSNCFILDAVRKSRTAALTRPEKGEAGSSPIWLVDSTPKNAAPASCMTLWASPASNALIVFAASKASSTYKHYQTLCQTLCKKVGSFQSSKELTWELCESYVRAGFKSTWNFGAKFSQNLITGLQLSKGQLRMPHTEPVASDFGEDLGGKQTVTTCCCSFVLKEWKVIKDLYNERGKLRPQVKL